MKNAALRLALRSCSFIAMLLLAPAPAVFAAPDAVDLGRIVVTAGLIPQKKRDVPQSVDVITRADIESSGAESAAQALRSLAGVDVVSLGPPADDSDVRIRGSDRDEVLVLLDGVPLNNVTEARALLLDSIPVAFIEKIEVVRGAQSVLYGGSAGGGVVNVITRRAGDEPERRASFRGGNLATFSENVLSMENFGAHDYAVSYSRDDAGGRFENDRYGANSIFFNYGFSPSDVFRLRTRAAYLSQNQELAFGNAISFTNFPTINYYVTRDLDRKLRREVIVTQTEATVKPLEWYDIRLAYSLYYQTLNVANSNSGEAAPEAAAAIDSQLYDAKEHRHQFDLRNTFRVFNGENFKSVLVAGGGAQLEYLNFRDAPFPGDVTAKTTTVFPDQTLGQKGNRHDWSGYLLSTTTVAKRLTLSAGARYDDDSTYGTAVSPRVSASYLVPVSRTKVFGGFSQGFFAPTVNQYYLALIGGTLSQRLSKEVSRTVEIGAEQPITKIARAGATFFYTDYDTFIDEVRLVNDAHVLGVETKARVKPLKWLTAEANYTYMRAENDDTGGPLASRPAHRVNALLKATPIRHGEVSLGWRYVSKRAIPNVLSTQTLGDLPIAFFDASGNRAGSDLSAYSTVNLTARYVQKFKTPPLKELAYSARVDNVFNASYQEKFGSPLPRLRFLAGVEARF